MKEVSMRYGFCTGFATSMTGDICYDCLDHIKKTGYDFVELPLMQTAALSEKAFDELCCYLEETGLDADCTCNLFPPFLKVTQEHLDVPALSAYLDLSFSRLSKLGTKTIIFGSAGARNLPPDTDSGSGYRRLAALLQQYLIPLLEQYEMELAIEPIGRGEANFINTLSDGMELVRLAAHPRVRLLADTTHMIYENENAEELSRFSEYLSHVHVSELHRLLPYNGYTERLSALLEQLRITGYCKSVSFESGPSSAAEMAAALQLLRKTMEGSKCSYSE